MRTRRKLALWLGLVAAVGFAVVVLPARADPTTDLVLVDTDFASPAGAVPVCPTVVAIRITDTDAQIVGSPVDYPFSTVVVYRIDQAGTPSDQPLWEMTDLTGTPHDAEGIIDAACGEVGTPPAEATN
jgi:hypothetical protein